MMDSLIYFTASISLLLSASALFITCSKHDVNPDPDLKGHIALRRVNALAEELGFDFSQYNYTDITWVNKKNLFSNKDPQELAKMLVAYLGLQIFEGKELRKIKKDSNA